MQATVVLYVAQGCHLCQRAHEDLEPLRAELGFAVEVVDITGDAALEERYRSFIPVVEVGGDRISVYRVEADSLRHKLGLV